MKSIIVGLIVLLFSLNSYAEEYPEWLLQAISHKKANELAYYSHVNGDCPVSEEEVRDVTEFIFVENKVEPTTSFGSADLYMDISVECIRYASGKSIFSLSVKFGQYKVMPATFYNWNIGMFGIGPRNILSQSLKSKVQEAIDLFIQANSKI